MAEQSTNIIAEKLRIAMVKNSDMNFTQLGKLIDSSASNIANKFKRNNFSESDIREIATALGYDVDIVLISKETGERI